MYLWRKYDQLWDVVVDLWFCCSFKTPWFWDGSWSGLDLLPLYVSQESVYTRQVQACLLLRLSDRIYLQQNGLTDFRP